MSEAGRRVRLTGTKQHVLVALLALNAGRLLRWTGWSTHSGVTTNRTTP
jgi:hypothetical protein